MKLLIFSIILFSVSAQAAPILEPIGIPHFHLNNYHRDSKNPNLVWIHSKRGLTFCHDPLEGKYQFDVSFNKNEASGKPEFVVEIDVACNDLPVAVASKDRVYLEALISDPHFKFIEADSNHFNFLYSHSKGDDESVICKHSKDRLNCKTKIIGERAESLRTNIIERGFWQCGVRSGCPLFIGEINGEFPEGVPKKYKTNYRIMIGEKFDLSAYQDQIKL